MKKILDVCCAYRGIWFDKNDSRAIFQDIRNEDIIIEPNAAYPKGTILKIHPDVVGDFTKLQYKDNSFFLVIMDPPHMYRKNPANMLAKKYGVLKDNWKEIIGKGLSECFRVLKPNGVLIFKWNEYNIKIKDVLQLTEEKPLFGHKSGKQSKTHWVCFMKSEEARPIRAAKQLATTAACHCLRIN
jgi:SAM-dependent methyltransferase